MKYSIAPSKLGQYLDCNLSFAFSAHFKTSGRKNFLSKYAVLGTIIHKFLENFIKHDLDTNDLDVIWIQSIEEVCSRYPNIQSHMTNRFYGIEHFVLKKSLTYILAHSLKYDIDQLGNSFEIITEMDLSYRYLAGTADLVAKTHSEIIIRDFKTGPIANYLETGEVLDYKEKYRIQLAAYGLMVKNRFGFDPKNISLYIQSINGDMSNRYSPTIEEYTHLESRLEGLLETVDHGFKKNELDPLGSPSISNCQFCDYKRNCSQFAKQLWSADLYRSGSIIISEIYQKRSIKGDIQIEIKISDEVFSIANLDKSAVIKIDKLLLGNQDAFIDGLYYQDEKKTFYATPNTFITNHSAVLP